MCASLCALCLEAYWPSGTGEELGLHLSGVVVSCLACCLFLHYRGRFPWWGGFRTPWYHGPLGCLLRKCRAAHGPRHPAVTIPLRLCLLAVCFFVRCLLDLCMVSCVVFLVFGVEMLFGLVPFKTCPLFALVFVALSFFLSCCGDVRWRHFLSFSLSQVLGKLQTPFWGLGFPLCFFTLDADSVFNPYSDAPTPTPRSPFPRTVFIVFRRSSGNRSVVWFFFCRASVCMWRFLVLLVLFLLLCLAYTCNASIDQTEGRVTIITPFSYDHGCFLGKLGEDPRDPHATLASLNWSRPAPPPFPAECCKG